MMPLQRQVCAAFTRCGRRKGEDSDLAFTRERRNCTVSSDHRPPTSAASTTRRALPPSPPAPGRSVPSVGGLESAPPRHVLQPLASRCRDTIVVSTASCAPCHKVNPSATISNRRPSSALHSARSMSHTEAFVVTLAPRFVTNLRCSALKWKPPSSQNPCLGARCAWWPREAS